MAKKEKPETGYFANVSLSHWAGFVKGGKLDEEKLTKEGLNEKQIKELHGRLVAAGHLKEPKAEEKPAKEEAKKKK